jgi:hypothetical protein
MSKRSPSADDDDHDRFQATKSRKRSSNKGGGGGSIQSNKYTNISAHGDSIEDFNVNPTNPRTNQNTNQYTNISAHSQKLQELRMMVEQQALEIQRQALEILCLGLGRGEVP